MMCGFNSSKYESMLRYAGHIAHVSTDGAGPVAYILPYCGTAGVMPDSHLPNVVSDVLSFRKYIAFISRHPLLATATPLCAASVSCSKHEADLSVADSFYRADKTRVEYPLIRRIVKALLKFDWQAASAKKGTLSP
ncbi:unnamed protein product [Toxocara canis]|uniref:DDE Tnp4 domain-containing protein n=1 Tax=Toxocara canis TaxID=6265 RepID=A0A183UWW4_TOXCA|nr:unnamed protein product [Toxocara canis]